MDNFTNVTDGYRKEEVNEFVDYVIKKTEENIDTIRRQNEEIRRLNLELEKYSERLSHLYQIIALNKIDAIDVKNRIRNKTVLQYSDSMELLNKFENANLASIYLRNDLSCVSGIRSCCNNLYKTAYGYIWKYAS